MRGRFKIPTYMTLALASLPALAHAQSISTWSLPDPEATATTGAQGPVDAQNPIVRPATPETGATATPSAGATPSPVPTITPLPVITPSTAPRAPAGTAPSARSAPGASASRESATSTQAAAPTAAPSPATAPTGPQSPAAEAGEPASTPPAATDAADGDWPAWWWAIPAAIAAGAAVLALFLFRRRRTPIEEWEEEVPEIEAEPLATAPEPEAPAPAALAPLQPLPTPNFTPPPAPRQPQDEIGIEFEPVVVRLSLFYATLQYRMVLTAHAAQAPLKLLGDLISAHASLSREEQLAPSPETLGQLHDIPGLASGETVDLKGEIQLPLSQIRALSKGGGSFLVPLVRLGVIGEDGTALRRVFTLGLPGGGAGLAPLRIDTGPRNFEPLAAREIDAARQFPLQTGTLPLDPRRVAG